MRLNRVFAIAFGITGIVLLVICAGVTRATLLFRSHALHTTGKVVDFKVWYGKDSHGYRTQRLFSPVIEFSVRAGKQRFVGGRASSSPGYALGEQVEVLYLASAPDEAEIKTSFRGLDAAAFITGFTGAAFGGLGLGFSIAILRKRRTNRWLAEHGARVGATYKGVVTDKSVSSNGRHPKRLKCEWVHPTTRKVYPMESEEVWFDPSPYVKRETLDVLVDLDNPHLYRVDIDFLPKLG